MMKKEYLDKLVDKIEDKMLAMDSEELLLFIVETLQIQDAEEFSDLRDYLKDGVIDYFERMGKLRSGYRYSEMTDLSQALDIDYTEQDYEQECEQERLELEQQHSDYEQAVRGN